MSAARVHIAASNAILALPGGEAHPVRPNTPVLPYGAASGVATYIDPTVQIQAGNRITLGSRDFVAPFAKLLASGGYIRIGQGSAILDNAVIAANPSRASGLIGVTIGEKTIVSYGAVVTGSSTIGGFGSVSPTMIGANAVINNATISPGAIVDAGATVTGVTIPSGMRVLPHAAVTSQAEASDPKLGKVVPVTASELSSITSELSNTAALAAGYTTLYQGQSATGAAGAPVAATPIPNLFNGNLAAISGASQEPGSPTVSFEPTRRGPRFPLNANETFQGNFHDFPARIIGGVVFGQKGQQLARVVGRGDSIRGDEGQPITIGSIARLGDHVTIHAVRGGSLTIGQRFTARSHAVILGGVGSTIGDDVSVGRGAVVNNSKIGSGVTIGDGAFVSGTTLAPGVSVPAGAVIINGVTR